mgnify:CR=1 FL=1
MSYCITEIITGEEMNSPNYKWSMKSFQRNQIKDQEAKEEALIKRVDNLTVDEVEMGEAIDTLKRFV